MNDQVETDASYQRITTRIAGQQEQGENTFSTLWSLRKVSFYPPLEPSVQQRPRQSSPIARACSRIRSFVREATRPPAYYAPVNDDLLSSRSPSGRANRVERFQSRMTKDRSCRVCDGSASMSFPPLSSCLSRCPCMPMPVCDPSKLSARVRAFFRPHHGDIP
jgi:hypothetical protein